MKLVNFVQLRSQGISSLGGGLGEMGPINKILSSGQTITIIALGTFLLGSTGLSYTTDEDYKSSLKLAEQKVLRQIRSRANPNAVSASLVKALFGRYYRVGDSWEVAAWQNVPATMRMTSDEAHLQNQLGSGGIFHYEVVNLKSGAQPQIVLEISQVKKFGLNEVDPKVRRIRITLSDLYTQSKKSYLMNDSTQEIFTSPNGIHSSISPLELFPLDVPDVFTAEQVIEAKEPILPQKVHTFLSQSGIKTSFSTSKMFEQDDFFGRHVQVLWNQGEPWPAYIKTSGGIAVLINKGNL